MFTDNWLDTCASSNLKPDNTETLYMLDVQKCSVSAIISNDSDKEISVIQWSENDFLRQQVFFKSRFRKL
jgi:hypothetical protein